MSETKRPVGRPSKYSPELAEYICNQIANGMSLRQVCTDETMPNKSTVMRWLAEDTQFCDQYARAREQQMDLYADEIIEIADSAEPESGAVQKARLQIDARKWLAAKLYPKKYGDKTEVSASMEVKNTVADLTDEQLRQQAAELGIDLP